MATRKEPRPGIMDRTPLAEWTAAGLGLLLTVGVIGYSLWEGVTRQPHPPSLVVTAEPARPTDGGHVVRVTVRNDSHATAAGVEVLGVLEQAGRAVEERRTVFAYVPGKGEARGGLIFQRDPAAYELRVSAEGYEKP